MRLFVTVGTQYPFDRLVRTVDEWADRNPGVEIFAQVGPGKYVPRNMRSQAFITADDCRANVQSSDVVVAHAGMGSIITALEACKPIIVMPRRADLLEHRNDHQMATARKLEAQGKVTVAYDERELSDRLKQLQQLCGAAPGCADASPRLLATVRDFIVSGRFRGRFAPTAGLNALARAESFDVASQAVQS
jgi:UDP-N-acetylglucosamine transferase subunit ALG13